MNTATTAPAAPPLPEDLAAVLKRMRMPYLRAAAPEVLATARSQRWDPTEVLRVLLAEEARGRDEATRAARRKAAGLPAGKTFASWREADSSIPVPTQSALATLEWVGRAENLARGRDEATRAARRKAAGLPAGKTFASWREADSSIPVPTQSALATLEWVGRAENLAISGPSGTGKTHFVEALAHQVIDAGMRVSWFTLESLTAAIGRAGADGSIGKTIARITRAELIVVDDIGMLPSGQAAAEAFYRLVDATYERRSLAVTSNIHPAGFDTRARPPPRPSTASSMRLMNAAASR
ncbi:ATP-binding protein [Kocuria sp. UCD-OTCP]|uniref:ATP-binding protein n=1 Tax=Kocuria sp. UCD-OTCP TaxID=1292021 RepID=UPI002678EE1F|nr:ATP-binding protein [Kocuria sp. UCD-OTCP]